MQFCQAKSKIYWIIFCIWEGVRPTPIQQKVDLRPLLRNNEPFRGRGSVPTCPFTFHCRIAAAVFCFGRTCVKKPCQATSLWYFLRYWSIFRHRKGHTQIYIVWWFLASRQQNLLLPPTLTNLIFNIPLATETLSAVIPFHSLDFHCFPEGCLVLFSEFLFLRFLFLQFLFFTVFYFTFFSLEHWYKLES